MKLVSGKVLESAESMILDVYGPVDVPGGVEGVPGRTRGGHEGEGLELAEGLGGARCSAKMPEVSEAGDGDLGEEAGDLACEGCEGEELVEQLGHGDEKSAVDLPFHAVSDAQSVAADGQGAHEDPPVAAREDVPALSRDSPNTEELPFTSPLRMSVQTCDYPEDE